MPKALLWRYHVVTVTLSLQGSGSGFAVEFYKWLYIGVTIFLVLECPCSSWFLEHIIWDYESTEASANFGHIFELRLRFGFGSYFDICRSLSRSLCQLFVILINSPCTLNTEQSFTGTHVLCI